MSWRLMDAALDVGETANLSPSDRLVLVALASHADGDGRCFPSVARLCRRTGFSDRAVQRSLRALCAAGVLEVLPGGGRGRTNRFRVRLGSGVEPDPAAASTEEAEIRHPSKAAGNPVCESPFERAGASGNPDTVSPFPEETPTLCRENPDTESPEQINEQIPSFATAQDGRAVARPSGDLAKQMFDLGVAFLGESGIPEPQARRLIGRWRRGRDPGVVLAALAAAQREGVTDPVPFVEAVLRKRAGQVIPFRPHGGSHEPSSRFVAPAALAPGAGYGGHRAEPRSFAAGLLAAAEEMGFFSEP